MRSLYQIDPGIHFDELEDLIDQPVVINVTDFDEECLEKFNEDLDKAHYTKQPVIPIVIDSYGGDAYACLGFISAIQTSKLPVATIIESKAMSAGAILFCFGTEGYRYIHPDAVIMIHDLSSDPSGKIEEIKASADHLANLNETVYKRVSSHLGHKPDYLSQLIRSHGHADWFLTAKEAKKHRIANHLKVPNFKVEIKFDILFE
jgi:ATP-dependent protease ClpP protease subunit